MVIISSAKFINMNTLKLQSKGDDVKTLQSKLNLVVDGIFGPITENAVKVFQKKNGLTPDGVVGPNTWKALGVTNTTNNKCIDDSFVYYPLSSHISYLPNRQIRYIAIHFTAGINSNKGAARLVKEVFEERNASADFAVDDVEIVQINPDIKNYYCWSVGDKKDISEGGASLYGIATNRNTISIEICSSLPKGVKLISNNKKWYFTEAVLKNAIKLTKILMKQFNIPLNNVVRHYDISGKLCPGILGWNNGRIYSEAGKLTTEKNNSIKWDYFKSQLK